MRFLRVNFRLTFPFPKRVVAEIDAQSLLQTTARGPGAAGAGGGIDFVSCHGDQSNVLRQHNAAGDKYFALHKRR